ncbi:bifunctional phosphoribosyl-AMP cyclohydrolase/phosphoribosyl-ATP diphosphatase HisIE [Thermospira aquatica]|uniref:Histidine biosynthesis bifunctional protein HisIE n=1 Tax=Thermospira aquatica TaxID=2828656 RepID=A0AAX3BFV0_9SPIR|nr:bifunctional phosphoribosyl-AMP cyclohydrolase/phosphoribosyl-ATP diphosphatase HisIE [Thermospira aquatica]URA11050.1 bifunctional phosphoribosyl-AMP cyclohydrolase/phosphoribosyl-ATP diphosphatase HisIE [Thermospira aquatica]
MEIDIKSLHFDEKGLIPAIVQDIVSGKVLTLAYMNEESLKKSLETGETWFYSRSRQSLWHKGETSGNIQKIVDILVDCDGDALLIKVEQKGVACHTGKYSCFFTSMKEGEISETNKAAILSEIYQVIMDRKKTMPENSYVAKKMREGLDRILKKIGEEAGETIIAVKNGDPEEIAWEMADLIFHLWLTLGYLDLSPDIIYDKLMERRK